MTHTLWQVPVSAGGKTIIVGAQVLEGVLITGALGLFWDPAQEHLTAPS